MNGKLLDARPVPGCEPFLEVMNTLVSETLVSSARDALDPGSRWAYWRRRLVLPIIARILRAEIGLRFRELISSCL